MPASATTLIQRTRRYLRDWPYLDELGASITSSATTLTVSTGANFSAGWDIEVDNELMWIRSITSNTLTVFRGYKGTTAASHAASAAVLAKPAFASQEYLDAINAGIKATFPYIYKPVLDTSLTTSSDVYEYTVPSMPSTSIPIPYLSKIEAKYIGEDDYRAIRSWRIRRGATPKIQFRRSIEPSATLRVHGYGSFPELAFTDSLDTLWPDRADDLLVEYAAQRLMLSGEAGRVRFDIGPIDEREQANRVGSSTAAAAQVLQRFRMRLSDTAMPPLPPHVVETF